VTKGTGTTPLFTAGNKGWQIQAKGNAYYAGGGSENDLFFAYWDGATTKIPVVLDSLTGNLGLGTALPATTLDVNGTIGTNSTVEGIAAYANSAAAYTIPDTSLNIRRITLTANTTITLPAFTAPAAKVYSMTLFLKQDATGTRSVTWAGNGADTIKWDSGIAPAISITADKITIIQLTKPSDESVWYGSVTWRETDAEAGVFKKIRSSGRSDSGPVVIGAKPGIRLACESNAKSQAGRR
ncbi:MAG: hypothetical protein AABZ55_07865, partial [Bdellovibrionota bacterium]